MSDDNPVLRMLRGQRAAAERARALMGAEGPRPEQAVAEALSVLTALAAAGSWPAPRDPVSVRGVEELRQRWARIEQNARKAQAR